MNATLKYEREEVPLDEHNQQIGQFSIEGVPNLVLLDLKMPNINPSSFAECIITSQGLPTTANTTISDQSFTFLSTPAIASPTETSNGRAEFENIFNGLVEKWKKETGGCSLTMRRYAHPAYQSILTLGEGVIPLILRELKKRPDWWFEAMKALAKTDPTKPGDNFNDAASAWLNWGKRRNLIS